MCACYSPLLLSPWFGRGLLITGPSAGRITNWIQRERDERRFAGAGRLRLLQVQGPASQDLCMILSLYFFFQFDKIMGKLRKLGEIYFPCQFQTKRGISTITEDSWIFKILIYDHMLNSLAWRCSFFPRIWLGNCCLLALRLLGSHMNYFTWNFIEFWWKAEMVS